VESTREKTHMVRYLADGTGSNKLPSPQFSNRESKPSAPSVVQLKRHLFGCGSEEMKGAGANCQLTVVDPTVASPY